MPFVTIHDESPKRRIGAPGSLNCPNLGATKTSRVMAKPSVNHLKTALVEFDRTIRATVEGDRALQIPAPYNLDEIEKMIADHANHSHGH
jgi:hypothetical protein